MKNLSNKMLYVNDDSEEIVVPLSRFLGGTALNSDVLVKLYFDSHDEGYHGGSAMEIDVTCTDSEAVLRAILHAFASSRDLVLNLSNLHSNITALEVKQEGVGSSSTAMVAGTGITTGTGTVYKSSIVKRGNIIKTSILLDITGLASNVAGDIIGKDGGTANCHVGQWTAAKNGTMMTTGRITCLEVPAGGSLDIDFYYGDLATGAEDAAIATITNETSILEAGGNWAATNIKHVNAIAADKYIYMANGGSTSDNEYTAGQFLVELYGYV